MLGVSSAAASNAESDPGKEGLSVVLGVSSAAASDPESDPSKEGMSRVADGISVGSSSLQSVGSVQSVLPSLPFLLEESNGAFGSFSWAKQLPKVSCLGQNFLNSVLREEHRWHLWLNV